MNMKKILLAGIAVGALAATSANAVSLSAAKVNNIPVSTLIYTIADKVNATTAVPISTTTAATNNVVTMSPTGKRFDVGNYAVTFNLSGTGNPVFLTAPALTVATPVNVACTVSTPLVSNGGVAGSSTVTYLFNVTGSGCAQNTDGPASVSLDFPFSIRAPGSVSITGNVTLPSIGNGTGNYDSVGPATQLLVQSAPSYDFALSANPYPNTVNAAAGSAANFGTGVQLPTLWSATTATPFTAYAAAVAGVNDLIIGSLRMNYAAAPATAVGTAAVPGTPILYSNLQGQNITAGTLGYDLAVTAVNTPGFATMRPGLASAPAGTATTVPAPAAIATAVVGAPVGNVVTVTYPAVAAAATFHHITVAAVNGNITPVTTSQAYKGTLTPKGANVAAADPLTLDLETTLTQGFRIDAPWFGGSRAATPSLVRLSNSAATATGNITMTLSNAVTNAGEPLVATSCPVAGVPAGQELLINTALATSCFGNFVRGDLAVTVLGTVSNLTAKMRVLSANGSVSEQTLGNVTASTPVSQ